MGMSGGRRTVHGTFFMMTKETKRIFLVFLLWALVVNVFGLLALNRLDLRSDTAYTWIDSDLFSQTQRWDPISLHARWDSSWYLDIARNGYSFKGPGELSNVVFFPLYPLLIRSASFLVGGDLAAAGWVLSLLFLLFALVCLHRLVKEFHPGTDPQLAVLFLLVFPTAFFLNAVYTESLFLFLSLAVFYCAFRKNFVAAGLFGLLAALTRVTGVLLFIPLVWEYWSRRPSPGLRDPRFLAVFLVPLGTFGFFLFHYLRFGDLLLFLKVERWWGRAFTLNKEHFALFTHPATVNLLTDALFVVFAVAATWLVFRRLRTSYGLYMLATILVALSTGTLMSIGRYVLVLFPMYILIASAKDRLAQQTYAFASTLLLAMDIALFVNNYWAG